MGLIFSRRHQKTTVELLEEIEKEIDDLETSHADKEYNRRRWIGYLLVFAVVLLIGSLLYGYFFLFPVGGLVLRDYVLIGPLIVAYPMVIWCLKWAICWWYEQSADAYERRLTRLRRRKRDILDTIKDKETYKVAKEILERFDPQVRQEKTAKKAREFQQQLAMIRRYASLDNVADSNSQLRNRRNRGRSSRSPSPQSARSVKGNSEFGLPSLPAPPNMNEDSASSSTDTTSSTAHPPTPIPTLAVNIIPQSAPRQFMMRPSGPIVGKATIVDPRAPVTPQRPFVSSTVDTPSMMIQTPIRLPRPIIPQNRSAFDKMIDYLLGEGPSSRYALICQRCHAHNGMALKEEIESLAFRCCYCFAFNPARKLGQPVPTLARDLPSDQTDTNTNLDGTSTQQSTNWTDGTQPLTRCELEDIPTEVSCESQGTSCDGKVAVSEESQQVDDA